MVLQQTEQSSSELEAIKVVEAASKKPEDQWSYKSSPEYWPGITTTIKNKKHWCENCSSTEIKKNTT